MMNLVILLSMLMQPSTLSVTSSAFKNEESIPEKYTCEGANNAPEITVSDIPAKTISLAIIMHDPDAPGEGMDHWVLFNITPVNASHFENDYVIDDSGTAVKGINGKGANEYTGPCPPQGVHHYNFTVYALDATLKLKEGASRKDVEAAMEGHILATGGLLGLYEKKNK